MAAALDFVVLVADRLDPAGIERLEADPAVEVVIGVGWSRAELLGAVGTVDGLIVRSGVRVDAELIEAAPRLKVVGRAGVGVDNIDLDAAGRRAITVTNTPEANTVSTAEHAFALMLAAARLLPQAHTSVAAGRWERNDYMGRQLQGCTLGVIGFGRVGQEVARRALAFGMEVLAADPYVPESRARDHRSRLVSLEELLGASDVVTLHAGAQPNGEPLMDAAALAVVKPQAILVNTARGSLLDAQAARVALDRGHLAGIALDVYDPEPPPPDHPLVGHRLVVHTPHVGASTGRAQHDSSIRVVENVLAVLHGALA